MGMAFLHGVMFWNETVGTAARLSAYTKSHNIGHLVNFT